MRTLSAIVATLNDGELYRAHKEYLGWQETGHLRDGIIRDLAQEAGLDAMVSDFLVVANEIHLEIAKRHYAEKEVE